MTTGLERIAAKARSHLSQRFTSLAHHITAQLLWESLNEIPHNSSTGIDKISVDEAKKTFATWSKAVLKQIHDGGYRPPPARRVYIPKPGKAEKRPLNVPTVIDRALQRSVSKILTGIYEADFQKSSFGGRPNLSAHHAVATVRTAIEERDTHWVYEADLKNFFGSLNHGWVEQFIDLRVGDPRITKLIKRWLKAGHMENSEVVQAQEGAAQGGPISVLISNIYLHYVLDLWVEKKVKPAMRGALNYVRYLDDFLVCFQYEEDALRFQRVLVKRLDKFSLVLEPSKTRLVRFGRSAKGWSRRNNQKMQTLYFLGFTFYNGVSRKGRYRLGMKTEKSRYRRSVMKLKAIINRQRHKSLAQQILSINQFLTGSFAYYGILGNYGSLRNLYYYAIKQWRKALSSRSQSGRINWEKYRTILKYYPIRKPFVRIRFRELQSMALL